MAHHTLPACSLARTPSGHACLPGPASSHAGPGHWIDSLRTCNSRDLLAGEHRLPGLQPPRLSSSGGLNKANSSILRKDADGSEDLYRYRYDPGRGLYLSTDGAGAYDTIRYVNNRPLWADGDTGMAEYCARSQDGWQLVRRQDTAGNALAFLYNKEGQVRSVVNGNGEAVHYDYSNRLLTRVRSVTNALGQTMRFAHDTVNRRTTVTDALGPSTHYHYDAQGQLLRITGPAVADVPQVQSLAYTARGDVGMTDLL